MALGPGQPHLAPFQSRSSAKDLKLRIIYVTDKSQAGPFNHVRVDNNAGLDWNNYFLNLTWLENTSNPSARRGAAGH